MSFYFFFLVFIILFISHSLNFCGQFITILVIVVLFINVNIIIVIITTNTICTILMLSTTNIHFFVQLLAISFHPSLLSTFYPMFTFLM